MFEKLKDKSLSPSQERFDTIIGRTTQIYGRLVLLDSVRIDGKVVGNIETTKDNKVTVAIGTTGEVSGDITAHRVMVAGKVEGNIYAAERVEFHKESIVQGDISYGSIAVEHGARLLGLVIRDETAGFGGRSVVTLGKRDEREELPWTRLNAGSPVVLSEISSAEGRWRGVVTERDRQTITVALAESPEPAGERPTFRLDLSADEIARQRQRSALLKAETAERGRLAALKRRIMGLEPPAFRQEQEFTSLSNLDESQRAAIRFALSAEDIAIIHGPPGTGKTQATTRHAATLQPIGERAASYARRFVGVPYRWAGTTPSTGFDCSGFVRYVYGRFGIRLPHSSYADFGLGRSVDRWALKPGDLVFFDGVGHVGLYVGHGRFIHSPHAGATVQISSMRSSWGYSFNGARRIVAGATRRLLNG